MKITKFVRVAAVGLVLGLLTGWLFSVAVPSTAQTGNLSWCLAKHTGDIDVRYKKPMLIWPGTSDRRYALVTVEVPSKLNIDAGVKIEGVEMQVFWEDGGKNERIISVGNSITVWAQRVEVRSVRTVHDGERVVGKYTITFNLCGP